MDIFKNSILSTLKKHIDDKDVHVPGIDTSFTKNEMDMWWEMKLDGSQSSQKNQSTLEQEKIFKKIKDFLSDTKSNGVLIDATGLEKMGFDLSVISLIDQYVYSDKKTNAFYEKAGSNDSKLNQLFMAIYLNSFAISKPQDLVEILTMFVGTQQLKISKKDSGHKKQIDSDMNIDNVVEKCQNNHTNDMSVKNLLATKMDDMKKEIEETILYKVPDDEKFLSLISEILLEPQFATSRFELAVSSFLNYVPRDEHKGELISLMKGSRVNLKDGLWTMRHELFTIALPSFLSIKNMDSSYVLDIILNTLYGCNTEMLRAFKETIDFKFISDTYHSDNIIKNVDAMVNKHTLEIGECKGGQDNTSHYMIKIWKIMSAFIVFLSLFRIIFQDYKHITVAKFDGYDIVNECQDERLLTNCIYYYQGNYYIKLKQIHVSSSCIEIKTNSFYELFYQIYKNNDLSE